MARNIIAAIFFILLVVGAIYWYRGNQTRAVMANGAVHCSGCMTPAEKEKFDREDHGESADGNSERKLRTARADDAAGFPDADTTAKDGDAANPPMADGSFAIGQGEVTNQPPVTRRNGPSSMTRPEETDGSVRPRAAKVEQKVGKFVEGVGQRIEDRGSSAQQVSTPARDTEAPNAPNGERFGGTGKYTWYRQGDLTWRLDTVTGASCVDYATMEEWHKPLVLGNGCGRHR